MSSVRNPVGPQPPSVYWRRRAIVLLGLVAVVVIVVLIIVRPGSENAGQETPRPADTPDTEQTEAPAAGPRDCDPAVLDIQPVTDSDSYASGQQPQISVQLTNNGSAACTLTVGEDQLVFAIVSGEDPIWTSSDCLTTPAFEIELQPGQPVPNTPIAWDRTRSSTDTCGTSRPEVVAGGATYRLSVQIGTLESSSDTPFLLN
ncbi:hypothetical protein [Pseudolysinimonas sp.]